jgi:hypothetical protein
MGWQSGKDALEIISDTERREPIKQEACMIHIRKHVHAVFHGFAHIYGKEAICVLTNIAKRSHALSSQS